MLVRRSRNHYGYRSLGEKLSCDPLKGHGQPLLQPDGGFPTQNFTQTRVVAVAATHALRTAKIVAFRDPFAGNPATMSTNSLIVTSSSVPKFRGRGSQKP